MRQLATGSDGLQGWQTDYDQAIPEASLIGATSTGSPSAGTLGRAWVLVQVPTVLPRVRHVEPRAGGSPVIVPH